MVKIRCDDYGFDCDCILEGSIETVIFDYWIHMNNEHGIDYSKETICSTIQKKIPKTNSNELIIAT